MPQRAADCHVASFSHWNLLQFMFPLCLTNIYRDFSSQILTGSLARVPGATQTLAAYGVAWFLTKFTLSPLYQTKQVGLTLAETRRGTTKVLLFSLALSGCFSALLLLLGGTSAGLAVIRGLHHIQGPLAQDVQTAVCFFSGAPVFIGMWSTLSGVLMRHQCGKVVAITSSMELALQIAVCIGVLHTDLATRHPLLLPVLAIYSSKLFSSVLFLAAFSSMVWPHLPGDEPVNHDEDMHDAQEQQPLTAVPMDVLSSTKGADADSDTSAAVASPAQGPVSYWSILEFFWPLVLTQLMQGISRPLINVVVSRLSAGSPAQAAQLAALTVVYPLAHLLYGWLNELKSLGVAFVSPAPSSTNTDSDGDEEDLVVVEPPLWSASNALSKIARFAAVCSVFSFGLMSALAWIAPLRHAILSRLLYVPVEVQPLCFAPLVLFSFFPLTVAPRAFCHGLSMLQRRTRALAPSGPARIVTVIVALLMLPLLGVKGATLGLAALLCGFIAEAMTAYTGVVLCAATT